MKKVTIPKEVRGTVKRACKAGWLLEQCGSGHLKLSKPGHQPVFISSSASCRRSVKNIMHDLKRAGVPV